MYPIAYAADYVEPRNRLTTFFRFFMLIPHAIVSFFWAIGVYVSLVVAWFALVFTGRYPAGLYAFNARAVRFFSRVNGYAYLLTDEFPPFGGGEDPRYPVRVEISAPAARYSRAKAFFRLIVGIPVMIMAYLYAIVLAIVPFLSWVVVVFTGRQPRGLQDLTRMASAYSTRAMAYFLLLSEAYPPITDRPELESVGPAPQLGGV